MREPDDELARLFASLPTVSAPASLHDDVMTVIDRLPAPTLAPGWSIDWVEVFTFASSAAVLAWQLHQTASWLTAATALRTWTSLFFMPTAWPTPVSGLMWFLLAGGVALVVAEGGSAFGAVNDKLT